ncbi:pancreatic polypeptide prohormone [Macrotis lagotis]|uniref:pancreatic polypeptide prohormone n=1 Tax=Macrotis lagotis TaxID=92651 RepID=UPI003D693765
MVSSSTYLLPYFSLHHYPNSQWSAKEISQDGPAAGILFYLPHSARLQGPKVPCTQMATSQYWLSLLVFSSCVALWLMPCAQGIPQEPVYPGDDATPEQMTLYAAELRRYLNKLTRPRYGKRSVGQRIYQDGVDFLE